MEERKAFSPEIFFFFGMIIAENIRMPQILRREEVFL
jgi:hypothetical protein